MTLPESALTVEQHRLCGRRCKLTHLVARRVDEAVGVPRDREAVVQVPLQRVHDLAAGLIQEQRLRAKRPGSVSGPGRCRNAKLCRRSGCARLSEAETQHRQGVMIQLPLKTLTETTLQPSLLTDRHVAEVPRHQHSGGQLTISNRSVVV